MITVTKLDTCTQIRVASASLAPGTFDDVTNDYELRIIDYTSDTPTTIIHPIGAANILNDGVNYYVEYPVSFEIAKVSLITTDNVGGQFVESKCLFMECNFTCMLGKVDSEGILYYYALTKFEDCDCNCADMKCLLDNLKAAIDDGCAPADESNISENCSTCD